VETATATARAGDPRAGSGRLAIAASTVFWIGAGLVAAGVAIRFATLGLQSYHHDEVITAGRVLPGSFGHMLHEVRRSESTPPLYYIIAWEWSKHFGLDEVGLRSLSALFGALTIPIAFLIGRELAGKRAGLLTMAMVALNPMLIWYSQEARAYALVVLLCAASLFFFLRFRRTGSNRDLALWATFSALALTSHYFAVFTIVIEAAWLLFERRPRAPVMAAIGGIAAVGLALLPLAAHQANPNHIDWIGHLAVWDRLEDSGGSFLIGETGRVIGAVGPREKYTVVPLILIGLLLGIGLWRGRSREWRVAAIGIVIGLGSVALALLAAAAGKDYVLSRNLLPALLPLIAAVAVIATFARARRVGVGLIAALCVYWLAFDVYVDATPDLQRPNWRQVAQTVRPAVRPRVIVTWTLGVAPLEFYLRDGTARADSGPFVVPEVDVVTKSSATRFADPLAAKFPHTEVTDLGRFTVTRYIAPHPIPLGMRLLRHLRTGFLTNAVMIGGGPQVAPGSGGRDVRLVRCRSRLRRQLDRKPGNRALARHLHRHRRVCERRLHRQHREHQRWLHRQPRAHQRRLHRQRRSGERRLQRQRRHQQRLS
jgi:mannosyltransferase